MLPSSSLHYRTETYLCKERFLGLREQLLACTRDAGDSILEIGPGPGLLTALLSRLGIKVTTLDTDERLLPDIVGGVTAMPCASKSFDTVCAFQVLEHLPWDSLVPALSEMRRTARKKVIFSVPDHAGLRTAVWGIRIGLFCRWFQREWSRRSFPGISNPAEHHWEIGCNDVTTASVLKAIEQAGLSCTANSIPCAYFHFFICEILPESDTNHAKEGNL